MKIPNVIFRMVAFAAIMFLVSAAAAAPFPACAPAAEMIAELKARYGEEVIWASPSPGLILTRNAAGGWTLLAIARDGETVCAVSAGPASRTRLPGRDS